MPIIMKNMGKPLIVCDQCDKPIKDAYLANLEWQAPPFDETDALYFEHKSCSKSSFPGSVWMGLTEFLVFLQNNAGFSRSKQGKAKESLMAQYEVGLVG